MWNEFQYLEVKTKSFYSEWYHYCEQIPLLIVHWHWLGASWQVFSGLSRPFGWWMCVCMCLCMFIWVCARARVNVWEIFHVLECGKLESYKRTKASCCTGCRHLRRLSTLVRLLMAPAVSPESINGRKCPRRVYKRRVVSANRKAAVIYTTALGWVGVFFFFSFSSFPNGFAGSLDYVWCCHGSSKEQWEGDYGYWDQTNPSAGASADAALYTRL